MVGSSTPKILQPLHVFSTKLQPSSSTLSFMKNLKTLIHSIIFSHVRRAARALSKATVIVFESFKELNQPISYLIYPKKKNKILFGSFRLHYNWCSSRYIVPVTSYYDSTWNASVPMLGEYNCNGGGDGGSDDGVQNSQLSGYLQWLEERKIGDEHDDSMKRGVQEVVDMHEIDKLAEMFIESCHEKFRLEKQESYRRFQEMMAKSIM